tara:strand:- start:1089 stop:1967 length:879 start_codon:yes stop_codon:yes gene_type:complete
MIVKKRNIFIIILCLINLSKAISQELDVDELLERLDRIEKNISDLQKGRFEEVEKSLSTGYISRNESRLGDFETKLRTNFGLFEESNNKINNVEEKLNLIDKDFQSRISKIEKRIEALKKNEASNKKSFIQKIQESPVSKRVEKSIKNEKKSETTDNVTNLSEEEIKKKYENAIKLLWANKYEKAEDELLQLKQLNPDDLMPNIQYWLGEVYYANKNFQQAVIEFGEGFANFPDSIKGPDNLLKLGLSFSNMNQKNEACSAFYELEVKYKSSPKNVLERSQEERKKLNCPEE